jgi:diguanylate cyclase (GGDEF)-like protein/PAS domain S-box-containing protein
VSQSRVGDAIAPAPEQPSFRREALRASFALLPLNMATAAIGITLFSVLWWNIFPHQMIVIWGLAIMLCGVVLRYIMWHTFRHHGFAGYSVRFWERTYLVQTSLAGFAWGLGPTLVMRQTIDTHSALLVAMLFGVSGVAINTLSAQRQAMQIFILAAMLPPAAAAWASGAGALVAYSLLGGAVVLLVIGGKTSQGTLRLIDTELRMRTILDTALDAVIETDSKGRITDWNRQAQALFGWSKSEALGQALFSLIMPTQTAANYRQDLENFLATGASQTLNRRIEVSALRRSGEVFAADLSITPIQSDGTWQFTAFITDITERKRDAAALHDSEERFRSLIELSPEAILVHRDGKLLYANPAAVALFGGETAQNLVGKAVMDLIHPDFRHIARERINKHSSDGSAAPMREEKFLKLDGTPIDVEVQGRSMTYDGAPAVYASMHDITERKLTQQALQIAATAFESLQGITITDANKVILQVNRAFTEITGYSSQEAIGKTTGLLSSGRHDAAFYASMWASIDKAGTWQGEIWNRHKSGDIFPEWLTITAVKTPTGVTTNYVATFTDISARKRAEDQIRSLAFYDPLTQLPNRRLLMDRLEQALLASERRQRTGALFFIDLDNFKTINDTLGHYQGDLLLEQVAKRLTGCIREGDTVARLGGDEFVVMLEDLSEDIHDAATQAEGVGSKVLQALGQPYQLNGHDCRSTPSIGVALFVGQETGIDDLLKRADLAMYQAKTAGRNTLRFFDPLMQAVVVANAALEVALRRAIHASELTLFYQAQVTGDGQIVAAEALVRWIHPERGMVSPAEFIPVAEQTGLILPLGRWVLETACTQLKAWADQPGLANLTLAVNVSARQFRQNDFVTQVTEVLERTGANPQRLKLELTESLLVDNIDDIVGKMTALKTLGLGFSLDDFGTGYSSLAYLSSLPFDQLKIDLSFVAGIETSDTAVAICAATISLAHSLKMKVVAEGVETQAQLYFLSAVHRCDYIQGYLFSRPLPLDAFKAFANQSCA